MKVNKTVFIILLGVFIPSKFGYCQKILYEYENIYQKNDSISLAWKTHMIKLQDSLFSHFNSIMKGNTISHARYYAHRKIFHIQYVTLSSDSIEYKRYNRTKIMYVPNLKRDKLEFIFDFVKSADRIYQVPQSDAFIKKIDKMKESKDFSNLSYELISFNGKIKFFILNQPNLIIEDETLLKKILSCIADWTILQDIYDICDDF